MHTSPFLSSPFYLLQPTRLNPPHAWRQYVLRSTFSFFQNSFPNVHLIDFLEADPSGVPKPGHRTHGATSRMVCPIQLAPPCPSINALSLHSIISSRLISVLIRPQANFLFMTKSSASTHPVAAHLTTAPGPLLALIDFHTRVIRGPTRLSPRVDVQFVMKENQLEKARCEKGAS